jgi:hypothetical protein
MGAPQASAAQVTSGLLVDINVENPSSYSGSGSVLTDVVGTNNSGTLVSSPTYSQGLESAIRFDGVNQYMQIQHTAELQLSIGSSFTYMFWGKVETYTAYDAIVSKQYGAAGAYDGFCLCLDTGNKLVIAMNGNSLNEGYSSAANAYNLNTWMLVTAVVRMGGGAGSPNKIYVNGTEVASQGNSETGLANYNPSITVAAGYNGTAKYGGISMGALAIYNRALSAAEIATSYDYYSNYFNDVSSIAIGASANMKKGQNSTITATVGARGSVRFFANGKRIAGCLNVPVSMASYPLTATCTWKPTTSGQINLSARLYPSAGGVSQAVSSLSVQGARRSTTR